MDNLTIEYVTRLLVAAALGGVIGLERNYRAKEAGFRTHFLVALGSALFMLVSQFGFGPVLDQVTNMRWDASRVASQVVTGIGFIGAGTIIFQKQVVRGLTTAAGLWVTSAIGLTCGSGMYVVATVATVLVLACLEALNFFLARFGTKSISITFTSPDKQKIADMTRRLRAEGAEVSTFSIKEKKSATGTVVEATMEIKVHRKEYERKVMELMTEMNDVDIECIE